MPGKYWELIMEVAVDNGGYVTPALTAPHGVPAIELRKMVARGALASVAHGVYRVPSLPIDPYDEFIVARLWAKGRGVVSHDSALLVHELCDINPTKVHITIPTGYRIGKAGAEPYVIHRSDLTVEETFRRRQKHAWPPDAISNETWQRDFDVLVAGLPFDAPPFEDPRTYLTSFVDRITAG